MKTAGYGLVRLSAGAPAYPSELRRYLGDHAPEAVSAVGNAAALGNRKLGLFCSVRCPGDLILKTYDLARALRDAGIPVIGGFHSPMEKECLSLLLRGTQPLVICLARSLDGMRIPTEWRTPLARGRLLLLSPFEQGLRRPTAALARTRNEMVAALADDVFIAYAEPGGKTEAFARDVIAWGKPVLTLDSTENVRLIALGAKPVKDSPYVFGMKDSRT